MVFSRTHQFASGAAAFLPVGGHDIHGRKTAHIWSDDGAAFTIRFMRKDGVQIDLNVLAAPANHWRTPLHPDEILNIEASSAAGSNINVAVV